MGLAGETRKGFGCCGPFAWWRHWRGWYRSSGGGFRWPPPREHEKQPPQGDQRELVENEVGYHGKVPSHRWCKGYCTGLAGDWEYPHPGGTRPTNGTSSGPS